MRFEKQEDDAAFERVLELAHHRVDLPIFGYAVMPNHWHFVVQPRSKTQVADFFRWLTHTQTMRWNALYHTEGTGGEAFCGLVGPVFDGDWVKTDHFSVARAMAARTFSATPPESAF